jgi:hypothetical protein
VQRAAEGEVKADVLAGKGYEIIPVGRKAESYFRFRGYRSARAFAGFSDNPTYADAKAIGQHVVDLYASGEVDRVELVYTRFITPGSQEVVLRPLVPLSRETVEGGDGKAGSVDGSGGDYEFEPDPTIILETLLPRYVEARVYAALLNAAASEHAFRQRAMKSATDNADELIKNLSRVMNRARQDSPSPPRSWRSSAAPRRSARARAPRPSDRRSRSAVEPAPHPTTFLDIRPPRPVAAAAANHDRRHAAQWTPADATHPTETSRGGARPTAMTMTESSTTITTAHR